MIRLWFPLVFVCVLASAAAAGSPDNVPGISDTAPGITPEGALAPMSVVEGPGIKVGEGTVLHPIVGMETGFISNVFYNASGEKPVGAAILRLLAQIGTGSLPPQRLAIAAESDDGAGGGGQSQGTLQYRADLHASYDVYLSGDRSLKAQNGLGAGLLFRGIVYPSQPLSFLFLEDFQRLIRATNFESTSQTNRDINRLQLGIQYAPTGRSVSGLLHYENVVDLFEDVDQRFANRMQNTVGTTVSWRFRPVTVFYADASIGFFRGLGSESTKVSSYPLNVTVGAQTLLTLNTTVVARVGYSNGFYSSGPSYSSVIGGLEFGYRYSRSGRVTGLYAYNYQDSINANFYRDHDFRLSLEQQFAPFVLTAGPEVRFRHYAGVQAVVPAAPADTRDDVILSLAAGLRYNFRDSVAGVVEYRLSSVLTDFTYMINGAQDDPSYTRHEVVAGVRVAL